ncbi:hypothetical protein ACLF6K_06700 [Streptomyces xanthophaeus]|uniref:hypothetical protein n=1 Tax=Streptomyces xanthophaeus TaxID=67385 RepID=UPI0039902326
MNASPVRRTELRTGALVLGALTALLSGVEAQAAPTLIRAEIQLSCDPNTWHESEAGCGDEGDEG